LRKNRRKKSQSPKLQPENHLHFRLCHVCLFLNESEQEVEHCHKCGSVFQPDGGDGIDSAEAALNAIWEQVAAQGGAEEEEFDEPAFAALRRRGHKTVHGLKVRW
jgi:hypothetical protein